MSNKTRLWLSLATLLVFFGGVIFALAMTLNSWDFTRLSTEKYETNSYEITEDFYGISVDTATADIAFLPSPDGKCRVVCYENEKLKHSVSVTDGALTICVQNEKAWYDYIGISWESESVTVYLPKTTYDALFVRGATCDISVARDFSFASADIEVSTGDVSYRATTSGKLAVGVSTGDVSIDGVRAGDITVESSTGKVSLKNITAENASLKTSSGDILLENAVLADKLSVEVSTGDVTFERSDAGEIEVVATTGDICGTLLSGKNFETDTKTGSVSVPENSSGGRCFIKTSTGDIRIAVAS